MFVREFVDLNVYMESFMLHAKNLVKEDLSADMIAMVSAWLWSKSFLEEK